MLCFGHAQYCSEPLQQRCRFLYNPTWQYKLPDAHGKSNTKPTHRHNTYSPYQSCHSSHSRSHIKKIGAPEPHRSALQAAPAQHYHQIFYTVFMHSPLHGSIHHEYNAPGPRRFQYSLFITGFFCSSVISSLYRAEGARFPPYSEKPQI